jgi:hypothetical protein
MWLVGCSRKQVSGNRKNTKREAVSGDHEVARITQPQQVACSMKRVAGSERRALQVAGSTR